MTNEFLDNICVKYFIKENNLLNTSLIRSSIKRWPNLREYIKTRYGDIKFTKFGEVLYRMKYHIEHRNLCPVCGKPTKYRDLYYYLTTCRFYSKYCSAKCAAPSTKEKNKETCLKKYGVEYISQAKFFRDKVKETCLKKFGHTSNLANEENRKKQEETCLEKYGYKNAVQNSKIAEKIKKTLLTKYGVSCGYNTEAAQNNMRKPESQDKRFESLKKNHSLQHPKSEENIYKLLTQLYGIKSVKSQYKCDKYPWHCDFYVVPKDLFIEVQGYFTHGDHPFDINNIDDKVHLNTLKVKYKSYYDKYNKWPQSITIWAQKDVEKRNTAINNKLNFIEIFDYKNINKIEDTLNKYNGGYKVI